MSSSGERLANIALLEQDYTAGDFFFPIGEQALGYWPATTADMRIYYKRRPRLFNVSNRTHNKASSLNPLDDEDELTIPEAQHTAVVDYVLWRLMEDMPRLREQAVHHRTQYNFARKGLESKAKDAQTISPGTNQRGIRFGKKGI